MAALESGLKRASQASLFLSVVLIIFGILAVALPMATSIGVVIVIGWLALLDGVVQLVHAFQSKGAGHIAWKLLVAVVYLVAGGYFIAHPVLATATFTLVLGIFLFAEGVADMVAYFATRKSGASLWMLLDGVVTLFLGFFIWSQWPFSSLWVIGTLVGISMIMTGTTRLMMTLAVRRLADQAGGSPLTQRAA
jgi:uncharacterized membrane protein HdeD (DUF308 family)